MSAIKSNFKQVISLEKYRPKNELSEFCVTNIIMYGSHQITFYFQTENPTNFINCTAKIDHIYCLARNNCCNRWRRV